jgi:hypothetical protein
MKAIVIIASLTATAALAGPFDQPYSIVVTDTRPSADSHMRPLIVNRVDEENSIHNRSVVTPGPHKVVLDLPPRKGFNVATQVVLDMDLKPCTRYYMVAILDSPTLQTWKPLVREEERIIECESKFKIAGVK